MRGLLRTGLGSGTNIPANMWEGFWVSVVLVYWFSDLSTKAQITLPVFQWGIYQVEMGGDGHVLSLAGMM